MKSIRALLSFATLAVWLIAVSLAGGAPPGAVNVDDLADKVSIKLGQELHLKFAVAGDRLVQPRKVERARGGKSMVDVRLEVTDSTPMRVTGVATRPYLVVSNGFERPLHYRALARLKGRKEFRPVNAEFEPVEPGSQSSYCWESGSLVEEIVLYRFTLTPKRSK